MLRIGLWSTIACPLGLRRLRLLRQFHQNARARKSRARPLRKFDGAHVKLLALMRLLAIMAS